MMGPSQRARDMLFYEFWSEDCLPADHLLRAMGQFVDLAGMRGHLAPFCSTTGRPTVDAESMIQMLVVI